MFNSGHNENNANNNNNDATVTTAHKTTKTVLKYSEKNPNMYGSAQTTEITQTYTDASNGASNHLYGGNASSSDLNNDYMLSNELNEIVLSNSIELNYFVFHNDKESVLKYISKYKKKLADKNNNHNANSKKATLGDYLSIRDVHGNTPMHVAAMMGHSEILKILLENGAVRCLFI